MTDGAESYFYLERVSKIRVKTSGTTRGCAQMLIIEEQRRTRPCCVGVEDLQNANGDRTWFPNPFSTRCRILHGAFGVGLGAPANEPHSLTPYGLSVTLVDSRIP